MRLSALQKFILLQCTEKRAVKKDDLLRFYTRLRKPPTRKDQIDTITKSIENLIAKELLIGSGDKTPHKWLIKTIRLTPAGRKRALTLRALRQKKLL